MLYCYVKDFFMNTIKNKIAIFLLIPFFAVADGGLQDLAAQAQFNGMNKELAASDEAKNAQEAVTRAFFVKDEKLAAKDKELALLAAANKALQDELAQLKAARDADINQLVGEKEALESSVEELNNQKAVILKTVAFSSAKGLFELIQILQLKSEQTDTILQRVFAEFQKECETTKK